MVGAAFLIATSIAAATSGAADQIVRQKRHRRYGCDRTELPRRRMEFDHTSSSVGEHLEAGGCFRDIFASLSNASRWPRAAKS